MAHVLVVDDVREYCEELATGLSLDGHCVVTAHTPQYAIQLGSTVRPDVLVADWLLQSHVYGLDVFDALRVIKPEVQTVLITGFATEDIYRQAKDHGVFEFLEKPFPMGRIRDVVRGAISIPPLDSYYAPVGIMEVETNGLVSYQNDYLTDMLVGVKRTPQLDRIDELLCANTLSRFSAARTKWLEFQPSADTPARWYIRTRQLSSERQLVVVLDEAHRSWSNSPVMRRVLGLAEEEFDLVGSRVQGHVLIVDDDEAIRLLVRGILSDLFAVCHTAQNESEAIRIFAHDTEIRHVLLDYEIGDSTPESLVQFIRRNRPDTHIVGSSGGDHAEEFARMDVLEFIPKPWSVEELVEMLRRPQPSL